MNEFLKSSRYSKVEDIGERILEILEANSLQTSQAFLEEIASKVIAYYEEEIKIWGDDDFKKKFSDLKNNYSYVCKVLGFMVYWHSLKEGDISESVIEKLIDEFVKVILGEEGKKQGVNFVKGNEGFENEFDRSIAEDLKELSGIISENAGSALAGGCLGGSDGKSSFFEGLENLNARKELTKGVSLFPIFLAFARGSGFRRAVEESSLMKIEDSGIKHNLKMKERIKIARDFFEFIRIVEKVSGLKMFDNRQKIEKSLLEKCGIFISQKDESLDIGGMSNLLNFLFLLGENVGQFEGVNFKDNWEDNFVIVNGIDLKFPELNELAVVSTSIEKLNQAEGENFYKYIVNFDTGEKLMKMVWEILSEINELKELFHENFEIYILGSELGKNKNRLTRKKYYVLTNLKDGREVELEIFGEFGGGWEEFQLERIDGFLLEEIGDGLKIKSIGFSLNKGENGNFVYSDSYTKVVDVGYRWLKRNLLVDEKKQQLLGKVFPKVDLEKLIIWAAFGFWENKKSILTNDGYLLSITKEF